MFSITVYLLLLMCGTMCTSPIQINKNVDTIQSSNEHEIVLKKLIIKEQEFFAILSIPYILCFPLLVKENRSLMHTLLEHLSRNLFLMNDEALRKFCKRYFDSQQSESINYYIDYLKPLSTYRNYTLSSICIDVDDFSPVVPIPAPVMPTNSMDLTTIESELDGLTEVKLEEEI